jgi:3',5'-cyclic AMP phosphodiesterase CpdA
MTRVSLLHITDLHYASPNSNFRDDDKAYVPEPLRANYFTSLHRVLKQCFRKTKFDALAVTGDFTTHGQDSGFDAFEKNTFPLLIPLVALPAAICMVPGNHDVVWDLEITKPDYFDVKFKRYSGCARTTGATTSYIPIGAIPSTPYSEIAFDPDAGSPLFLSEKVAVLCINSSIRCGEVNNTIRENLSSPVAKAAAEIVKVAAAAAQWRNPDVAIALNNAKTYLEFMRPVIDKYSLFDIPHVTHTQLDRLLGLLDDERAKDPQVWAARVKVAAVHHHLAPFDYQLPEHKAFEVMADASSLLDLLAAFGFQVILTGHKHQPYVQRVQSHGRDILILGGSTVGGYTVPDFAPSIRHLEVEASDGELQVSTTNLPCNFEGDISTRVDELLENAREKPESIPILANSAARARRTLFPKPIEAAVEDQLYSRNFYKSNVLFDVEAREDGAKSLIFDTKMSYTVVNRTPFNQDWSADYKFDHDNGTIVEIRFGIEPYDPREAEFHTARGLSVKRSVEPHGTLDFFVHARERWPDRGSALYTSYNPATDLKVILRSVPKDVLVDFEILYFWKTYPLQRTHGWEVSLDKGLLPNQGVKMSWKRKEADNGNL